MNILVFIAGVSVGWAADKLYNSYIAKKMHADDGSETFKAEEKDIMAVENVKKEKARAEKDSLKETHDDLSQLKGVGPKLAEALDSIGIHNYEQLTRPSVDTLLERLRETGGRFSRPVISAIMEQAKQAVEVR